MTNAANFNDYSDDGVFGRDSLSVAELLGEDVPIKRARKTGPTGKVHKVFEEVSKLPRRQQEKIVEVVSALVSQYAQSRQ
jgi:hypothetical protein